MNQYDPLHRLASPPEDEYRGNIHELLRRRGVVYDGFRLLPEDGMEWVGSDARHMHGRFGPRKHLRKSKSNNRTLCGRNAFDYVQDPAISEPLPCKTCVALCLTRRYQRYSLATVEAMFQQRETAGTLPALSARLFARCPNPANLWWCSACQVVNRESSFFVESDFVALCVCGAPCLYYWGGSWLSSLLVGWEPEPVPGNYYPLPLSFAPGDTGP